MRDISGLLSTDTSFKCRYKQRYPDPGLCTVISIDWEREKLSVTNGVVRLYPDFADIILLTDQ